EPLAPRGKLAFLFPGEGAQYVNMLADLCGHFPAVRVCFDEMDRAFADHPRGYVLSDLVFPRPAFSDAERSTERLLWQMDVAVEAVHTANRAMHVLLSDLGLHPDALLGHSTGEYSALRAAGALDEREYDARVSELNRLYVDATAVGRVPPSARLLAIAASRDRAERLCARQVAGVRALDSAGRIQPDHPEDVRRRRAHLCRGRTAWKPDGLRRGHPGGSGVRRDPRQCEPPLGYRAVESSPRAACRAGCRLH